MQMPIDDITVGDRKRPLQDEKVQELAESMDRLGLLNPITLSPTGVLLAGWHRLQAARLLGWEAIEANMVSLDELDGELVQIDENLIRAELSVLERAEHLQRRREIYEVLHPEAARPKAGRPKANSEIISGFPADASRKLGVTPRSVRHDLQIADGICLEARDLLRGSRYAEKKTELLAITKMSRPFASPRRAASSFEVASKCIEEAW